jgi:uncharacterized protein (UPF0216 family)
MKSLSDHLKLEAQGYKVRASGDSSEQVIARAEVKIQNIYGREYNIFEKKILVQDKVRKLELMSLDEQGARSRAKTTTVYIFIANGNFP